MTDAGERGNAAAVRRAPRWMKIALVVSVALNLLALGVVARAAYHLRHQIGTTEPDSRGFQAFVGRLPADRRDEVRALIEPRRGEVRELRRSLREARDTVRDLFVAETFDTAAFRAAHTRMIEVEARLREKSQSIFPDIAEKLGVEDRRRLADWRERRERWRERWRHRREPAE